MQSVAKGKTAKKKAKPGKKDNAVVRYLRETRSELRKVHWPTRQEAWNLTKVVLAVTISMALLLGLLDYLFAQELRGIVGGGAVAIGVLVVVVVAGVLTAVILGRQTAR
jgi:preprotein translocase subunit SecE